MKVILETDIIGLGEEGEIVNVSPGYARNYLFPGKKAIQNSTQNFSILESRKGAIIKRREDRRTSQLDICQKLENETINIVMNAGENGHLFGAVTASLISDELEKKSMIIPKKNIVMPVNSIKELGIYTVEAKLYQGISARFKLVVQDKAGNTSPTKKVSMHVKTESKHAKTEVTKNTSEKTKVDSLVDESPSPTVVDEKITLENPDTAVAEADVQKTDDINTVEKEAETPANDVSQV